MHLDRSGGQDGNREDPWWLADWAAGAADTPRMPWGAALERMLERAEIPSEVPDGWRRLVGELAADLEVIAPGYGVVQVKEKFGTLTLYASSLLDRSTRRGRILDALFDARIRAATAASARTCLFCGQPGVVRDLHGRLAACCGTCARRSGRVSRDDVVAALDAAFSSSQLGSALLSDMRRDAADAEARIARFDAAEAPTSVWWTCGRPVWLERLERYREIARELGDDEAGAAAGADT